MADPKYKSMPPGKKQKPPIENEGAFGARPIRGFGSSKQGASSPESSPTYRPSESTQKYIQQGKLQDSLKSSVGTALRGNRRLSASDERLLKEYKQGNMVDPERRARAEQLRRQTGVRGAVRQVTNSVADTALRFGSDKAFYWLMGLVLPTFGLAVIGLDILFLIKRIRQALKLWQKLTIVLLNLAVIVLALCILVGTFVYICNFSPLAFGIRTVGKVAGFFDSNSSLTFCKYFDLSKITSGGVFGGSSSGKVNKNIGTFNGTVPSGTAEELARQILSSPRVTLQNDPGNDGRSGARQNIQNTADGKPAFTSVRGEGGGGQTVLDSRMLAGILAASQVAPIRITFIAGGDHSDNSLHYLGRAFDAGLVNSWPDMLAACRAAGATEMLGPGNKDHDNHIHCGW